MKRIEFGELRIGEVARQHLMDVCDTDWASMGPKTQQFEKEWTKLFGFGDSVAVSSGTDGVINACLALYDLQDAQRGKSEVIVPALSFIATSNGVRAAGLVPKFVDVKKETLNIDEDLIEAAITEDTVAIMPVHTMGRMCEMNSIMDIADRHGLTVIEDACESHGASHKGVPCGKFGDMSVYSFYIAHLVCCGEGGMVSVNTEEVGKILRSTRSHGRPFDSLYFDHQRTGLNSKMNDMEASLGLEAVQVFWRTFTTRHKTMMTLREAASGFEDVAWFSEQDEDCTNCPHGFSITCKEEGRIDHVRSVFDKYNIHHKRNFGCIPTQHNAFADMGYVLGSFPNAEFIGQNGLHVGTHQYLTEEEITRISKAIKESLS